MKKTPIYMIILLLTVLLANGYTDNLEIDNYSFLNCCKELTEGNESIKKEIDNGTLILTSNNGCACAFKEISLEGKYCNIKMDYMGDDPYFCISSNNVVCDKLIKLPSSLKTLTYDGNFETENLRPYIYFYSHNPIDSTKKSISYYDSFEISCSNQEAKEVDLFVQEDSMEINDKDVQIVYIQDNSFNPNYLSVKSGEFVKFNNAEQYKVHKLVLKEKKDILSPRLEPGDDFIYQFKDLGEFIIFSQTIKETGRILKINVTELNLSENTIEKVTESKKIDIPSTKKEPELISKLPKKEVTNTSSNFGEILLQLIFAGSIIYFIWHRNKKNKEKLKQESGKTHTENEKLHEEILKQKRLKEEIRSIQEQNEKHQKEKLNEELNKTNLEIKRLEGEQIKQTKLKQEIEKIKKQNELLKEQKLKQEALKEEKLELKKELRKGYKKALKEAKTDYSGEELKKEITGLKQELDEELNDLDSAIKNIENKDHSLEQKIEGNKIIEEDKIEINKSESSDLIKKDRSYPIFLSDFENKSKNCESWADYVKFYMNLYGKDPKNLMNLAKFIKEKTKTDNIEFVYNQINELFQKAIKEAKPNIITDLKEIDDMTGIEFEEYLENMFTTLGYESTKTQSSRDGGVDLILKKEGVIFLVQAKRYKISSSVGVSAVRDVYSKQKKYKAERLIVLTTSMKFSLDATKEAEEVNVELWNRDKLKELLRKAKMIKNG